MERGSFSTSSGIILKSLLSPDQIVVQSLYSSCGVRIDTKTFVAIWKLCDLGIPTHAILALLQDTAKYAAKKWSKMDVEMAENVVESEKSKNSDGVGHDSADLFADQAMDSTQEASESLLAGSSAEHDSENLVANMLNNEAGSENGTGSENLVTETADMDSEINSENLVTETEPDLSEAAADTEELIGVNKPKPVVENASVFGARLSQLPLARIKHIMKMDTDVHMASQVWTEQQGNPYALT